MVYIDCVSFVYMYICVVNWYTYTITIHVYCEDACDVCVYIVYIYKDNICLYAMCIQCVYNMHTTYIQYAYNVYTIYVYIYTRDMYTHI